MTFEELCKLDDRLLAISQEASAFRVVSVATGKPMRTFSAERANDPTLYRKDQDFCSGQLWNALPRERGEVGIKFLAEQAIDSNPALKPYRDLILKALWDAMPCCTHEIVEGTITRGHRSDFPIPELDAETAAAVKAGICTVGKRQRGPATFSSLVGMCKAAATPEGQTPPPVETIDPIASPPPNDEAEPIYIAQSLEDAKLLHKNLFIEQRLKLGEISRWYAREAIEIVTPEQADKLIRGGAITKESIAGPLAWKPLVIVGENTVLEKALRAAGAQVCAVMKDVPESLAHARQQIIVVVKPKTQEHGDMPEAVLDGRLGDICRARMARFPRAFAWPALLTVASAMVPKCSVQTNLYTALVGPIGCGKSQAIEHACALLGITTPPLMDILTGSAEGLLKKLADVTPGEARVLNIDELGHLLEKAKIDGASFPYVLSQAYYKTTFEVTMARGREAVFATRLSMIGGIVEDNFADLFGSNTAGGFHDRFIFGRCPTGYRFSYRPFEGGPAIEKLQPASDDDPNNLPTVGVYPVAVTVQSDVFEALDKWKVDYPELNRNRVTELALRAAVICASFDGRPVLRAADLGPALALALNQAHAKKFLKPTLGKNMEAEAGEKIINYLDENGPATGPEPGPWLSRRIMYKEIHAERMGYGVVDRAIKALEFNGEIETSRTGRQNVVRRLSFE